MKNGGKDLPPNTIGKRERFAFFNSTRPFVDYTDCSFLNERKKEIN